MASSGLKIMLFYIILRHLKGVWENVLPNNIFILIFVKSFLHRCYAFLTDVILVDVIAMYQVVDVKPLRKMLNPHNVLDGRCYCHYCGRC